MHASGAEGVEAIGPKCEGGCDISEVRGKRARESENMRDTRDRVRGPKRHTTRERNKGNARADLTLQ